MMTHITWPRCLLILMLANGGCTAPPHQPNIRQHQDRPPSVASPGFMEQFAATRRFAAGRPASIRITPDGSAVLFLRSGPRSFVQNLYELDTQTGVERVVLTAEQILQGGDEELTPEEKARRERQRVSARGIVSYKLNKEGSKILVPLSGRLFVVSRDDWSVHELQSDIGFPIDAKFSPDSRYVSSVRDSDLYIMEIESGVETRITHRDSDTESFGLAEFVAQEEMGRFSGYWWSPDSTTLAIQHTDTSGMETMHIMDPMHPEKAPQTWPYPRPGERNAIVKLAMVRLADHQMTWVNWDRDRYPYLATVRWRKKNAPLTILVQNREQTEEALLAVDSDTGNTSILLVERDDAWLNLDQKMPYWLEDGQRFCWTTERNGSWQLELRRGDGSHEAYVTQLDFGLRSVVAIDEENNVAYVTGGDDPTQTHLYRVDVATPNNPPEQLTSAPGLHSATFSKNCAVYVHSSNLLDGMRRQVVRTADGTAIGELHSVAELPPFTPKLELTTVGYNPQYHAAIIRPRNFNASQSYPVIVYVYGGPHAQVVRAAPLNYLRQQWFADHGFIVVAIDGRGTPARGRDWERVIKGNLIDAPLLDQIVGLTALGNAYPEMDLSRVGIYGWSFGGYFSAMAVLRHPEVFHVGVAGAPVTDWRDYDTHYTERYMGLPESNLAGYEASSAMTYANKLERPLMLIHGTADDNVYFMHSLKLSNALFRAGKPHDFLVLSDFTHMVAEPAVTARLYQRMIDYFIEHLY